LQLIKCDRKAIAAGVLAGDKNVKSSQGLYNGTPYHPLKRDLNLVKPCKVQTALKVWMQFPICCKKG